MEKYPEAAGQSKQITILHMIKNIINYYGGN
jgi:hypothetical protein